MPVAFVLIGGMIYVAENIGTYFAGWRYADQAAGWHIVHPMKLVSWILLMTVSLVIVAEYKRRVALLEGCVSKKKRQQLARTPDCGRNSDF